jgi:SSS family solute:Na+ symporter
MVTQPTLLAPTVGVLCLVAGLGIWVTRGRVGSVDAFVTARNSTARWPLTASLVASVMGVWILFTPAEAGVTFGGMAAVIGYGVGEAIPMLVYARIAPRIRAVVPAGAGLTEYVHARYGRAMYAFVLLVSCCYMFVFLAAELTAITNVYAFVADVPRHVTAILVAGFVLLYTAYGGLRASILTDAVQTAVIVPVVLLTVAASLVALGGPRAALDAVTAAEPRLVRASLSNPTFVDGLLFGVWVSVAILGAETVNQVWWQRVYAAADSEDLPRAFGTAAVVNFGLVCLAGGLGVLAVGQASFGSGGELPANAVFVLVERVLPEWLLVGLVLVALLLVMSTADSLFNGIASLVTADIPRLLDDPTDRTLRTSARVLTALVAVLAVVVSLEARSVLGLFLFADLLGAAVLIPLLAGLYTGRVGGLAALGASVAGLGVGLVYFPGARWALVEVGLPLAVRPAPSNLVAFLGAAGVAAILTLAAVVLSDREPDPKIRVDRRRDSDAGSTPQPNTDGDSGSVR